MSTWGSLLADIRTDLKDTSASPRWSDAMLFLYAKDAIRQYSLDFPMIVRSEIAATGGVFPLPANFTGVISVEAPVGVYLKRKLETPGKTVRPASMATSYSLIGRSIYLDAVTDTLTLTYNAVHILPASEAVITTILSIPDEDEEMLRLYVKAKVSENLRTNQANLDRFKPGSGARDDNPLLPEADKLMEQYNTKVAERLGGIIVTFRPGRHR